MTKSVAILVINYNSNDVISRCLDCIVRQDIAEADVFVLDNGGDNPIPEDYLNKFPSVQFIRSKKNIGFAAGNNLLLEKTSNYRWVALVNPDAFLEPDWLSKMLFATRAYPEYSFFASRLVQDTNREMLDGDGDKMHICGLAWREGHGHIVTPRETRPKDVFSPCAAAALYRRDALDEVGGFDEEFFCYYEDIDIGFRLRLAGHRCLLVPDAVAYHIGSLSTGERRHSDFAVYHGHRNMVSTYVKDMPLLLFFLLLPAHITINIITIIWFSLLGQGAIICKAKYDAILVLPRMWKKRSDIKKYSIVSISEIWKVLDKSFLPPLSKLLWKGI